MARRPGYIRKLPSEARHAQAVWTALLRARRPVTAEELAERTGSSVTHVRHLLGRYEREGLAERDAVRARAAGQFQPSKWRLTHRLGALAPVLRSQVCAGDGYTDPNRSAA